MTRPTAQLGHRLPDRATAMRWRSGARSRPMAELSDERCFELVRLPFLRRLLTALAKQKRERAKASASIVAAPATLRPTALHRLGAKAARADPKVERCPKARAREVRKKVAGPVVATTTSRTAPRTPRWGKRKGTSKGKGLGWLGEWQQEEEQQDWHEDGGR